MIYEKIGMVKVMIRFSILVPVYNVKDYLSICINSIICQDFENYEIILVDDGSNDGSEDICDIYVQKYNDKIRVIHQKNKGLLLARRVAIKAAIGEYFIFVDSDDSLAPGALQRLDSIIKKTESDLVIYHADKWDGTNILPYRSPFQNESGCLDFDKRKDYMIALLRRSISNGIWSKAVKRSIVDIEKDYESMAIVSTGEDLLQSLPYVTYAKKIYFLNENLYLYRVNAESMTHTFSWKMYESIRCVNIELEKYSKIWKDEWNVNPAEELVAYHFITEVWEVLKRLIISKEGLLNKNSKSLLRRIATDEFYIKQYSNINKDEITKIEVLINKLLINKRLFSVVILFIIFRVMYRLKHIIKS